MTSVESVLAILRPIDDQVFTHGLHSARLKQYWRLRLGASGTSASLKSGVHKRDAARPAGCVRVLECEATGRYILPSI